MIAGFQTEAYIFPLSRWTLTILFRIMYERVHHPPWRAVGFYNLYQNSYSPVIRPSGVPNTRQQHRIKGLIVKQFFGAESHDPFRLSRGLPLPRHCQETPLRRRDDLTISAFRAISLPRRRGLRMPGALSAAPRSRTVAIRSTKIPSRLLAFRPNTS